MNQCGLFVHRQFPFLGASPDGLINEYGIIEIKCSFFAKNLNIRAAIANKTIKFAKISNGAVQLSRKDKYYYQVKVN